MGYSGDKEKRYAYDYGELPSDFRPGEELHDKIARRIYQRAQDSLRHLGSERKRWREVEDTLRVYRRPPEKRQVRRRKDDGEIDVRANVEDDPIQLVMPVSYATLETLLTYMTMAFFQPPMFRYDGRGPEDMFGAKLLEGVIEADVQRNAVPLALHTQWRDAFTYGFGVVTPVWNKEMGFRRNKVKESGLISRVADFVAGRSRQNEEERTFELLYEGNDLENIDPWRYYPDPNVPIHQVQKGEFVGWSTRSSFLSLLNEERDEDSTRFNAKYLKECTGGRSALVHFTEGRADNDVKPISGTTPVDVLWMYVTIIPKDWGLGGSEYPEKWMFGLAADKVLIEARPVDLDHNKYPVSVIAPDFDGHSAMPLSRMLLISDIQEVIDFMYSSRILNVKKSLNDMFVVDPSKINIWDLADPRPGKIIRMRRAAWGSGTARDAVHQLEVNDVTRGNLMDIQFLQEFAQLGSGMSDAAAGVVENHGPRISSTAAAGARQSSLSRLARLAFIISQQGMRPLGQMFASHTQQFLSQDRYVQLLGDSERVLREEYNMQNLGTGPINTTPDALNVDYDLSVSDGSIAGSEDAGTWVQLFQLAASSPNPQLAQGLDFLKVFQHIARQLGAKNIGQFVRTQPQVMQDDALQGEVEAGNLIPVSGDGATGQPPGY